MVARRSFSTRWLKIHAGERPLVQGVAKNGNVAWSDAPSTMRLHDPRRQGRRWRQWLPQDRLSVACRWAMMEMQAVGRSRPCAPRLPRLGQVWGISQGRSAWRPLCRSVTGSSGSCRPPCITFRMIVSPLQHRPGGAPRRASSVASAIVEPATSTGSADQSTPVLPTRTRYSAQDGARFLRRKLERRGTCREVHGLLAGERVVIPTTTPSMS